MAKSKGSSSSPSSSSASAENAKKSVEESQKKDDDNKNDNSKKSSGSDDDSSSATSEKNSWGYPMLLGIIPLPWWITWFVGLALAAYVVRQQMQVAYKIRLYAIRDFGEVIHEFDPWFNFRATQYFSKHGWTKFFHWFDYMSWYPLGRPVGTTIYPGLQITAVAIHRVLRHLGKPYRMSLNAVCCYMPAWFGSVATLVTALLTYEMSASWGAAAVSSMVMAIIPAHIMRSVGGGFDNESIAVSAMLITFYFWLRSVRNSGSWPFGILAGLAYGNMVAAWGGYIFVLNMISIHAALLSILDMLRNRYSSNLFYSYSLYYIIGTAIATRVPVVGLTPFKSLEQLSATAVFFVMLAIHLSEKQRRAANVDVLSFKAVALRIAYVGSLIATVGVLIFVLLPADYIGPLSSRVRALFVKHTLTGNPLVDSVAEHNPANADAYWTYLHWTYYFWLSGTVGGIVFCSVERWRGAVFLVSWSLTVYYFSLKMARMLILTGPVASSCTGIIIGGGLEWCLSTLVEYEPLPELTKEELKTESYLGRLITLCSRLYYNLRRLWIAVAIVLIAFAYQHRGKWNEFQKHADQMAHSFSEPQIMFKHRMQNGRTMIIDDYRDGYFWLRDKTPADARVLSWWDYGYQITGIGNRTTLADGNTWNHEHIATIGYMLSSPQKKAHSLIRHVADYVLVWAGGMGDDLGKSPHMARIGNSVYRDICSTRDPLCHAFSFQDQSYEKPTPMMRESLLYNAVMHNVKSGVRVDPKYFQEAFTSRHGLIRIFKVMNVSQESKDFLADPANRKCDAPGSWFCPGDYPRHIPAWKKLLAKRRDFGQLEDIHKQDKMDKAYYQAYMDAQRRAGRGG